MSTTRERDMTTATLPPMEDAGGSRMTAVPVDDRRHLRGSPDRDLAEMWPGWSAPHVQAMAHEWVMAGYSVAHGSMSKAASV
jgi:hypothetical protein